MAAFPHDMTGKSLENAPAVGPRLRIWLRRAYRWPRAKKIARDFAVSIKTAERWLAGADPALRHFSHMIRRWGEEFLRAIYPEAFAGGKESDAGKALAVLASLSIGDSVDDKPANGRFFYRLEGTPFVDPMGTAVVILALTVPTAASSRRRDLWAARIDARIDVIAARAFS